MTHGGAAESHWKGLIVALLLLLAAAPARGIAQGDTTPPATPVSTVGAIAATSTATLEFPGGIRIVSELDIDDPGNGTWLELVYRIGHNETHHLATLPPSLTPARGAMGATGWLDLQGQFVPPGLDIAYQWRLVTRDGVAAATAEEHTLWYDDRQDWQHLDGDSVSLHWFGLDETFARRILESAEGTVAELASRFGLAAQIRYQVWVYPNQTAFLEALVPNSREALAAATYPDFAITLAVVPNGNDAEIGRVVPHELAHLVLFEATDSPFSTVPLWFNEGLATQIQVGGTQGYLPMVIRALEDGTLYSLRAIDVVFPFTAYEATLAYAASWSALEYLQETWGDAGITSLIEAFTEGHPWDAAIEIGLGVTMDEFEQGWRDWIGNQSSLTAAGCDADTGCLAWQHPTLD